jgi:hypothetical protein
LLRAGWLLSRIHDYPTLRPHRFYGVFFTTIPRNVTQIALLYLYLTTCTTALRMIGSDQGKASVMEMNISGKAIDSGYGGKKSYFILDFRMKTEVKGGDEPRLMTSMCS